MQLFDKMKFLEDKYLVHSTKSHANLPGILLGGSSETALLPYRLILRWGPAQEGADNVPQAFCFKGLL